jgi:LacI family transcriptional regulator
MAALTPPLRRATMAQVAQLAGVSLKTVSRVVNGEAGVSPALEAQVRDAATRLGYRPNLGASTLRSGKGTSSIGVLVQDLGNDFCGELLRAAEALARARGVVVISASLDEEPERERDLVSALVARRCDGLVLMPATHDQSYLRAEIESGLGVVVVDRAPRGIAVDSVTVDNAGGSRTAVEHLARHGHRRIACLTDDLGIPTAQARLAGYHAGMTAAGLQPSAAWERPGLRTVDEAEHAVDAVLALPRPPTALFTARNEITLGALRALRRAGLSRTVAVVGFDDIAAGDLLEPPVTVIRQNAAAVGATALDVLLARLADPTSPVRTEVLETELVVRGSGEIPPPPE